MRVAIPGDPSCYQVRRSVGAASGDGKGRSRNSVFRRRKNPALRHSRAGGNPGRPKKKAADGRLPGMPWVPACAGTTAISPRSRPRPSPPGSTSPSPCG
ncbi:MAG: hypothetical protein EOO30_02675 [Comamonadaceae bacterium]|nr:MAG: hypothetical protein EOO30_02675 [Comamonadaceae bacterium]